MRRWIASTTVVDWTDADQDAARAEGWDLFDFTTIGLQFAVLITPFNGAQTAYAEVMERIREGVLRRSPLHIKACKRVTHAERVRVLGELAALAFEYEHGLLRDTDG